MCVRSSPKWSLTLKVQRITQYYCLFVPCSYSFWKKNSNFTMRKKNGNFPNLKIVLEKFGVIDVWNSGEKIKRRPNFNSKNAKRMWIQIKWWIKCRNHPKSIDRRRKEFWFFFSFLLNISSHSVIADVNAIIVSVI